MTDDSWAAFNPQKIAQTVPIGTPPDWPAGQNPALNQTGNSNTGNPDTDRAWNAQTYKQLQQQPGGSKSQQAPGQYTWAGKSVGGV